MLKNKEELKNAITTAVADYCYENQDGNFEMRVKITNDGTWSDSIIIDEPEPSKTSINLTKPTVEKLLAHGYKFIRLTDDGGSQGDKPKIKYSDQFGVWRTLEVFDTKAARDRRAKELILNDCYLYI